MFLVLMGCAVAAHWFANWRAEVRWQRYCAEARARGVKLTLADFAPPEIPDAENFAALPMFRAIFNGGVQRPMELPMVNGKLPSFGNPLKHEQTDWKLWQKYCLDTGWIAEITDSPPLDVLLGTEHYAPQMKEWREWQSRPRCRFKLDTTDIEALPLPHLNTFLDASKLFSLRLRAHLALGDSALAYEDLFDVLQSYRGLRDEPVLISGLVQIAALNTVLVTVGEGLAQHSWKNPELLAMAAILSPIQVASDYIRTFASERGYGNQAGDAMVARSPFQRMQRFSKFNSGQQLLGTQAYPPSWVFLFIPRCFYRDDQTRYNKYMDELCARVTNDGTRMLSSVGTASRLEKLEGIDAYYYFLFNHSTGVFAQVGERFLQMQTTLDETNIAIGLEHFRQVHGIFPETLAELVPEFIAKLPIDAYSEKPLVYRRAAAGTFRLYGVGKDRKDDGGVINPKKDARHQPDDIWLYAPPAS